MQGTVWGFSLTQPIAQAFERRILLRYVPGHSRRTALKLPDIAALLDPA